MRGSIKLFAAVVAGVMLVTPAMAAGNANFTLGWREMMDDEIEDVELDALDGQPVGGVTVDFSGGSVPFNWAIGLYRSSREEDENFGFASITVEVTFTELSFGVHKDFESGGAHPFVGGGVTYMKAEVELSSGGQSGDEDDTQLAIYGEGGVFWRLGSAFNIGVGGRAVFGTDFDLDGADLNGDYLQAGLILGWGWD